MELKTKAKHALEAHAKAKAAGNAAFAVYSSAIEARLNATEITKLGNAYTAASNAVSAAYSEVLDADRAVEYASKSKTSKE